MITATAGETVVVPPGYGHVTINPSLTVVLQMANLVSSSFRSEYRPYEELHGAAYYEMTGGEFVKNPHFTSPARLRLAKAGKIAAVKDTVTDSLYDLVEQRAEVLGFLNYPERYLELFSRSYP
jgi:glucose-6-phosphate isomerase